MTFPKWANELSPEVAKPVWVPLPPGWCSDCSQPSEPRRTGWFCVIAVVVIGGTMKKRPRSSWDRCKMGDVFEDERFIAAKKRIAELERERDELRRELDSALVLPNGWPQPTFMSTDEDGAVPYRVAFRQAGCVGFSWRALARWLANGGSNV